LAGLLLEIGYFGVFTFIFSSMLAMGMSISLRDLTSPLHNPRLVVLSLLANFVIVPVFAFILLSIFPVSGELAAGLILVSIAAGAPSTPKVAELTGGNIAYAVSLTLLMTLVTIVLMPLLVPYILDGVGMDPTIIAYHLVFFMLLPILAGMLLRDRMPDTAGRVLPAIDFISNATIGVIFLAFGVLFFAHIKELFGNILGMEVVVIALLFVVGTLLIGYAMGGPDRNNRWVLAFGTGFRNVTAALVVITAGYRDLENDVFLMVLAVTLFSVIIVSAIVGFMLKKQLHVGKRLQARGS